MSCFSQAISFSRCIKLPEIMRKDPSRGDELYYNEPKVREKEVFNTAFQCVKIVIHLH